MMDSSCSFFFLSLYFASHSGEVWRFFISPACKNFSKGAQCLGGLYFNFTNTVSPELEKWVREIIFTCAHLIQEVIIASSSLYLGL